MIFNVVVDTVIWHWVMVVAAAEAGDGIFRRAVQSMASFFYAGDSLLASTCPECLQTGSAWN